jgi:hypothetical protein
MPLRARVGRHANTGVNCQNVVEDQLWVIMELNLIPAADGGAQGSLTDDRVRAGIASDALYNAILRFQKKAIPRPTIRVCRSRRRSSRADGNARGASAACTA